MTDKLVLFDIDETLIDSGRAGTRALNGAFIELFHVKDAFRNIKMAGMTDLQIIREGLRNQGLTDRNGEVDIVVRKYLALLANEIENPWRKVKPGVFEVLEALAGESVPVGLLTGNLEDGAKIKLSPFGLNRYFAAGSFGSDNEDRDKLLPIAIRKFSILGINTIPEKCVVIGDTPRDVRCSRVHGAHSIGVATGPYNKDSLMDAGADIVVDNLQEKDSCLSYIHNL
jgi:phosphoglycolate phosphatase-like HAD superfamily hydrolase